VRIHSGILESSMKIKEFKEILAKLRIEIELNGSIQMKLKNNLNFLNEAR
jgi:hypothetical protein